MSPDLTEWLRSRTPEQLAAILATRPDATAPPVPRDLRELAERLEIASSVALAVHAIPAPALQVIEVLQLLGPDGGGRAALAGWLGRTAEDPELARVLELLASFGLVWSGGEALRMAAPLYGLFQQPLRLGPPAAVLLAGCPAEQLRAVARTLGLPQQARKDALVAAIAAVHGDPDRVRELVAAAAPAAREALETLATEGPTPESYADWYGYLQHRTDPQLRWARERGLVVMVPRGLPQVPREVAVALRGPGWHAPFTPQRPDPPLVEVAPAAVEREAAAAGSAAVEQVAALLEQAGGAGIGLLKAGGVGVKELRRLARALAADEAAVRLWLELAYAGGLLAINRGDPAGVLLPTAAYDEWAAAGPAERLATLLMIWPDLDAAPVPDAAGSDPRVPALVKVHDGQFGAMARQHLLGLAATLPAGRAVADPAAVAEAVCWHSPVGLAGHPDAGAVVAAAWREAHLLGVMAHGAATPLGRAAVGGAAALIEACRAVLPAAVDEAIFQADLTALVPGAPTRALADLLDAAATRETSGGAVTWRFSAGSVRRALDAGHEPGRLVSALRQRAAGQVLPQPLEYLVADVARRHGAVRVREVACLLRADDPVLLKEIAGARALRSLGLQVVAPTVLGSAAPVAETLAALRQAGYAPVAESADGVPSLERAVARRARPPARRRPGVKAAVPAPGAEGAADLAGLARSLLAAPVPPPEPGRAARPGRESYRELVAGLVGEWDLPEEESEEPDGAGEVDTAEEMEALATHLAPGERRLLAHAISTGGPVEIAYTNAQGNPSRRVIEPLELSGGHVIAWCQLRDDERIFALHRIAAVAPA